MLLVDAQHTLNNRHEYGTIDNIMTLLKPIHNQHLPAAPEDGHKVARNMLSNLKGERNPLTKRSQGRPNYRWEDNVKQDICQMKVKSWITCVQDRVKWKDVVEKAITLNH